jgi:hypothetical protein
MIEHIDWWRLSWYFTFRVSNLWMSYAMMRQWKYFQKIYGTFRDDSISTGVSTSCSSHPSAAIDQMKRLELDFFILSQFAYWSNFQWVQLRAQTKEQANAFLVVSILFVVLFLATQCKNQFDSLRCTKNIFPYKLPIANYHCQAGNIFCRLTGLWACGSKSYVASHLICSFT